MPAMMVIGRRVARVVSLGAILVAPVTCDSPDVARVGDTGVEAALGRAANGESGAVDCADGVDDDGDGAIDCADFGCEPQCQDKCAGTNDPADDDLDGYAYCGTWDAPAPTGPDCDDADFYVHPGQPDFVCNVTDDDCAAGTNGQTAHVTDVATVTAPASPAATFANVCANTNDYLTSCAPFGDIHGDAAVRFAPAAAGTYFFATDNPDLAIALHADNCATAGGAEIVCGTDLVPGGGRAMTVGQAFVITLEAKGATCTTEAAEVRICALGAGGDADSDTVPDACDRCAAGSDLTDGDSDGVPDACDVCPQVSDPNQTDADGDGLGAACDVADTDDDRDDDGLLDGTEDLDRDGTRDAGETGASDSDTDNDLIQDGTELGLTAGTGADTDAAVFVPDADPASTTDPLDPDTDGDGLDDGAEDLNRNGRYDGTIGGSSSSGTGDTDPNDTDTDGDTISDGVEDAGCSDPRDTDSDNGGVADNVEIAAAGNPCSFNDDDPDADGLDNGEEAASGTDRNDPDSDNDGLLDGVENPDGDGTVDANETDPTDVDTDNDGLADGTEDIDLDGTRDATETDAADADTDNDLIQDGTELGLTTGTGADTDAAVFVPDGDPTSTTDPLDADTDGDGRDDGVEDADRDGRRDGTIGGTGTSGTGETDPTLADTDGDGLGDDVEVPGCSSAIDTDSDDGGIADGVEDAAGTDPCDASDDDVDGDGLTGPQETLAGTDPADADSDDDGLLDGVEEANGDGVVGVTETDPMSVDTDADGVQDGTERGVTTGHADTDAAVFQPDVDPGTTTDPLDQDSDDDGLSDGAEDANADGRTVRTLGGTGTAGTGETNPTDDDTDGDGLLDGAEVTTHGTSPLDTDSDDGFVQDGVEVNTDGTDPTDPTDDALDTDNDGLSDYTEISVYATNRLDDDTDNDGFEDGFEVSVLLTNPNDDDTDGDGIEDGVEYGLTAPQGIGTIGFVADADPNTQTDPLVADSDGDGLADGVEDANKNGATVYTLGVGADTTCYLTFGHGSGESDPNDPDTDADGLDDGAESLFGCPYRLDPDSDDGGVLDGRELNVDGTNACFCADDRADTDADGLYDDEELLLGTDENDDDSDDDGLTDGYEVDTSLTLPMTADTDGDQIQDGTELGLTTGQGTDTGAGFVPDADPTTTTDPLNPDSDGDTLGDGQEDANRNGRRDGVIGGTGTVGSGETDATLSDTDGDLLDDASEAGVTTSPVDSDTDDGGVSDGGEVFVDLTDPLDPTDDALDTDGDGVSDFVETAVHGTDPADADSDEDGISDGTELFVHLTDPTEPDTDGDGLGDGLEVGLTAPETADTTAGTFVADADGGLTVTDPTVADTDGDGLDDAAEDADGALDAGETDPTDDDTDDDGASDGAELATHSTDPLDPDGDADGLSDGLELSLNAPDGDDTDLGAGWFVPDADAATTSPRDADSDDDGLSDGDEDADRNGAVGAFETDPAKADTDGDALQDGTELGITVGTADTTGAFEPDGDGVADTNPRDADTDDDGLTDGNEDLDHSGTTEPTETDPAVWDTDVDGLSDGVERALTAAQTPDTDPTVFRADLDPATTTDPNDPDTDADGLIDGFEDANGDGRTVNVVGGTGTPGSGESDPTNGDTDGDLLTDGAEPGLPYGTERVDSDTDDDGLDDGEESGLGTNPLLADTDGDFLSDGAEVALGTDPQVADTDGDGIVDGTEVDVVGTDPLEPDTDGDGLWDGVEDADQDGVLDPAPETDPTSADTDGDASPDGVDCQPRDAAVFPGQVERCNGVDDDCDGEIDEPLGFDLADCGDPLVLPNSVELSADVDSDGWGSNETTAATLCACESWVADDANHGVCSAPADCDLSAGAFPCSYEFDSGCWSLWPTDCNDGNSSVGSGGNESLDGEDNDCDGYLPLVEIDCDNDHSYALPPINPYASGNGEYVTAADLGLAACDPLNPPDIRCFGGTSIDVVCSIGSGLWVVDTFDLVDLGLFGSGRRLGQDNLGCSTNPAAFDCDDQCASRCSGQTEVCDGIDNDCNDLVGQDVNLNGVPDAMELEDVDRSGLVSSGELDLDGDGYVVCTSALGTLQTSWTSRACAPTTGFDDCSDECALANPDASTPLCSGFVEDAQCGSNPADLDGDDHLECGVYGNPELADYVEKAFALVVDAEWSTAPGATNVPSDRALPNVARVDEGTSARMLLPLIPPRVDRGGEILACDMPLAESLATLRGETGAWTWTDEPLDLASVCIRADVCRRTGIDPNDPTGGAGDCAALSGMSCHVVSLGLTAEADELAYGETGWVQQRHAELADLEEAEATQGTLAPDFLAQKERIVRELACLDEHRDQAASRNVWSDAQLVAAREVVLEWECYRARGTWGCTNIEGKILPFDAERHKADALLESGAGAELFYPTGGFVRDVGDAFLVQELSDELWWWSLGRYDPVPVVEGNIAGCWGAPWAARPSNVDLVGGDCDAAAEGANRDQPEGPDDIVALLAGQTDNCETCLDGLDNDCDGSIDCEDPACGACFVGQGSGCNRASPCSPGCEGCGVAPAGPSDGPAVFGLLALALVRRRRG